MNQSPAIQRLEAALTRLLGAAAPANQPAEVNAVWRLPGVEIALAQAAIATNSLHRVWTARQAGRGLPLLIVCPAADGDSLVVFGPRDRSQGSPYTVNPDAFVEEIEKVRTDAPGSASRKIEQALEVLGSEVAPGVVAHGLLTDHFVLERLPRNVHYRASCSGPSLPSPSVVGESAWRHSAIL